MVYSLQVSNIQITNIGEYSVGFRGCFLDAQYNRTNNIMCSNKCCICPFKKGTRQFRTILLQNCACVVKSYHLIKQQFYFCGKTLLPIIYKALNRTTRKQKVVCQADFGIIQYHEMSNSKTTYKLVFSEFLLNEITVYNWLNWEIT